MVELDRLIGTLEDLPVPRHAKAAFIDMNVVEEGDSSSRQLRQPQLEVLLYVLEEVTSVEVDQVDRLILEVVGRFAEGHPDEMGELVHAVPAFDVSEHLLAIEAGVLISVPGVNREAFGPQSESLDHLAGCEVRVARMYTEFDEDGWSVSDEEVHQERSVLNPCWVTEID